MKYEGRILKVGWRISNIITLSLLMMSGLAGGCEKTGALQKKIPLKTQTNSIGMKLVHLPGGTFKMGELEIAPPAHEVFVSPFWMGQYEVTNAQYNLFKKHKLPVEAPTNVHPAMFIPYEDAVGFCQWLSKKEKRHYRLPTEAEWEYACRGGLEQKKYPWGDESVTDRANFFSMITKPVGSYAPNAFGLYDMMGNVSEWVSDWYDEDYYKNSPVFNPKGPSTSPWGQFKTARGGDSSLLDSSSAERYPWSLDQEAALPGFRVVLETEKKTTPTGHQ